MERYLIKNGLVCRDIARIYFVIDPFDRHFYRNKQVTCVNSMGFYIVKKMIELKIFTPFDLVIDILNNINGEKPDKDIILKDIKGLIEIMKTKGWLYEQF